MSNHFFAFSLSSQTLCLDTNNRLYWYAEKDPNTHTHLMTCDYFPGCCTSAVLIKTIRPTILFFIFVIISNALLSDTRDCRTRLARPNSQARTGTGKKCAFSLFSWPRAGLATLTYYLVDPYSCYYDIYVMCDNAYIHTATIIIQEKKQNSNE